jgi:N-acetylglutamate synthase/N-acetylornithine aminotransferase
MLVEDGEGVTKVVELVVRGARTRRDALAAARSVANSPLVKTAINGADPNWGRIMMALGKSPARVVADRIAIAIGDEGLVERGVQRPGARLDRIREVMGRPEYAITIEFESTPSTRRRRAVAHRANRRQRTIPRFGPRPRPGERGPGPAARDRRPTEGDEETWPT